MAISAFIPMSYVEVNSNKIMNAGCYLRSDTNKPFFQMTSIFAANINGDNPNEPYWFFNPQVTDLLNNDYKQIQFLKDSGIKVLITILGNHDPAGWACMTDETAMKKFAKSLVDMVNQYELDGIDIDDEYSTCSGNQDSVAKIAQFIKEEEGFNGKILTKALFVDGYQFQSGELAKYLDFGWEMSYGGSFDPRMKPYIDYGMEKESLFVGVWAGHSDARSATKYIVDKGHGGIMVYDLRHNAANYLTGIAQAAYGENVKIIVKENCLVPGTYPPSVQIPHKEVKAIQNLEFLQ